LQCILTGNFCPLHDIPFSKKCKNKLKYCRRVYYINWKRKKYPKMIERSILIEFPCEETNEATFSPEDEGK
jgi:Fic family protein